MSIIAMTKNPIFHARTKHIELRHHFIRDLISEGEIQLEFISINDQPADVLTKAATVDKIAVQEAKRLQIKRGVRN